MSKKKFQIFISSTYIDLIEERQSAVEAVLDAGHIPAGMELFKAGNETQLDTIYKWIDGSDIYMLILGGRYGTIEPETQKSYTQLEYEYAISKGIPIFSVVLTDEFLKEKSKSLDESSIYEQENIYLYGTFKNLVMSKIIRQVSDVKDIKLTIHTTLVDFSSKYEDELVGWVRADATEENISLLKQVNELSSINQQLEHNNNKLSQEIQEKNIVFTSDLAFENSNVEIYGTYSYEKYRSGRTMYERREIKKEISWDEMFLLWSPYLTATLHSMKAKGELENALQDFFGKKVDINNNLFQKIKIQYTALELIEYRELKLTKGGSGEFISLTQKGKQYLIKNTAIKK